jgi:hypothetical protein
VTKYAEARYPSEREGRGERDMRRHIEIRRDVEMRENFEEEWMVSGCRGTGTWKTYDSGFQESRTLRGRGGGGHAGVVRV